MLKKEIASQILRFLSFAKKVFYTNTSSYSQLPTITQRQALREMIQTKREILVGKDNERLHFALYISLAVVFILVLGTLIGVDDPLDIFSYIEKMFL